MSFIPRMPYNRFLDAFLTFVGDVTNPYLNLFRRFLPPVRIGPGALDLSPMVGTFVLLIVGGHRRRPHPRARCRRGQGWARALATWPWSSCCDQATKQLADRSLDRGESVNVFFGLDLTNTRNRGVAFGALGGQRRWSSAS